MKSPSMAGANGESPKVLMFSAELSSEKGRVRRQSSDEGEEMVEAQDVLRTSVLYATWGSVEL